MRQLPPPYKRKGPIVATIEVDLDPDEIARLERDAAAAGCSLDEIVVRYLADHRTLRRGTLRLKGKLRHRRRQLTTDGPDQTALLCGR
jgi:hypothetical protein